MKLKDNIIFRSIIIPICLALCFVGNFIPGFGGLSQSAVHVLFIFLGALILWLTIGIDWPSLVCIFALGFVDGFGFKTAFKESFGNATFIFLLFTFICTYALSKTSIIKRITLAFINSKLAKKSGLWFCFLFLLAVLIVGLFMSPSVLFVIVLPILKEILKLANVEKGEKIGKALMIGLGVTVSISSGMTPIAHVFPVLAMTNGHIDISTGQYMLFAIPVGLIVFAAMFVTLFLIYRPNYNKLKNVDTSSLIKELPKITKMDKVIVGIFEVVILLWIIPDFFKGLFPELYSMMNGFTTAMPPLLGTIALCIIRVDKKPLLKVDEAFKNVPWASLVMCAATLALGAALSSDAIGIKTFLSTNLSSVLTGVGVIPVLIIFAVWAAVQTNLSSNMVTATLVATVAYTLIIETGAIGGLNYPALICIIGLLASFAFATPPSMPHIAIIGADEYCTAKDVLIFGSIIMVVSIVVALAVGYPLGTLIFA